MQRCTAKKKKKFTTKATNIAFAQNKTHTLTETETTVGASRVQDDLLPHYDDFALRKPAVFKFLINICNNKHRSS